MSSSQHLKNQGRPAGKSFGRANNTTSTSKDLELHSATYKHGNLILTMVFILTILSFILSNFALEPNDSIQYINNIYNGNDDGLILNLVDDDVESEMNIAQKGKNDEDDDVLLLDETETIITTSTQPKRSHSPITYKVIHKLPFNNTFDPFYKCDPTKRRSTSPIFKKTNIFDFHIQISTSLNILYMGDSVGIQFSQGLQEATGSTFDHRKVLRYSWRDHEGLHIASPVRGGGSVAGWRITGLLQEKQINNWWQMPQTPGGGWMEVDLRNIRRALAIMSSPPPTSSSSSSPAPEDDEKSSSTCMKSLETTRTITKVEGKAMNETAIQECPEKDFDVVIYQFPFGWFEKPALDFISYQKIHESVMLSNQYFGANIIILQTVPVGNNLIDFDTEIIPINEMIWNYTEHFKYDDHDDESIVSSSSSSSIRAVLVMDLGALSMELFKHNAHALGLINITTTEDNEEDYDDDVLIKKLNPLLDLRTSCCHYKYRQIIGFTCAEVVANFTKNCVHTKYSNDGHHFCLNEIGGRVHGATACLIKCGSDFSTRSQLRSCERRCNDQYMSLKPIPFDGKDELENY